MMWLQAQRERGEGGGEGDPGFVKKEVTGRRYLSGSLRCTDMKGNVMSAGLA
jgi:hypothetical protein